MNFIKKKLLTIVTESALETLIIRDIKNHGVTGYSLSDSKGEGSRGARTGDWDQARNIVFNIVCEETQAKDIQVYLHENYQHYALFSYMTDVEIFKA